MAYELHIESREGGIPLSEWKSAVAVVKGVRLCSGAQTITNPKTGEVISSASNEGYAEVYSPTEKSWHVLFLWFNGKISFKLTSISGDDSDHVWQAAVALASHLDAVICGDEGEIYDLKTRKPLKEKVALEKSECSPTEEIKFIFKYNAPIETVVSGLRKILEQNYVPETRFKLNGKSLSLDRLLLNISTVQPKGFDITWKDYNVSFGSLVNSQFNFLLIQALSIPQITWDDWAAPFISVESFVMAWVTNSEYTYWQNAEDPLQYTAVGKAFSNLPTKSNGLPYPVEKKIIDVSGNPGRWLFRDGYIEAVGSTMWLGDPFWQLVGTDKSTVEKANWFQVSNPVPSVIKIRAADKCFITGDGKSGELQNRLRALLFGN